MDIHDFLNVAAPHAGIYNVHSPLPLQLCVAGAVSFDDVIRHLCCFCDTSISRLDRFLSANITSPYRFLILLSYHVCRVLYHHECGVVLRLFASVCLSLCSCVCLSCVRALIFESFDLETSCFLCMCTFTICRSSSYIKLIGSRSRSQEEKSHTSLTTYTRSRVVRLGVKGNLVLF